MSSETQFTKRHAWAILQAALADKHGSWHGGMPIDHPDPHRPSLVYVNDEGVWPNVEEADFCWKPCHEVIDLPNAPDCSVTPGLPFPFNARQLAAWMLKGTGAYVASYFGLWAIPPDFSVMPHPDDNKARQAIEDAFLAYRAAVDVVGNEPDSEDTSYTEQYKIAWRSAREKHGLIEANGAIQKGLAEDEYNARLKLAHADAFEAKQALLEARTNSNRSHDQWIRRMVHCLALPPSDVAAWRQRGEADFLDGFSSAMGGSSLDADDWARYPRVTAKDAALLVCGINPTVCPDPEADASAGVHLPTFRKVKSAFDSMVKDGKDRTLKDWVGVAGELCPQIEIDVRVVVALRAVSGPVVGSVQDGTSVATEKFEGLTQTAKERQEKRWQLCIDAGLQMPQDTYAHFPRGIGGIAKSLGITRPALTQDLNEHRERLFGR